MSPIQPEEYDTISPILNVPNTTPGGTSRYMFNKIRIYLDVIQRKKGYPARIFHTVAFFSLIMFSIPFYTRLDLYNTIALWRDNHHIEYLRPMLEFNPHKDDILKLATPDDWKWRYVLIYDIPNELLNRLFTGLAYIPYVGALADDVVNSELQQRTMRPHPLFESLVMYGGLSNEVITANWDKIYNLLSKEGY